MEHRAAPSKFSSGFGVFAPPASKADKDRYSLIGAAALAGLIIVLGVSSRYLGFGEEEDHGAFLDDDSAHSVSAPRGAPAYRRESMDYLIPAEEDAPAAAPAAVRVPLNDAVGSEPSPQVPAALSMKRHRRSQQRVLAIGFKGGSGLSGGIGKSFQPILRQPLSEGSGQGSGQ